MALFPAKAQFGIFFGEYTLKLEGNIACQSHNSSHTFIEQRYVTCTFPATFPASLQSTPLSPTLNLQANLQVRQTGLLACFSLAGRLFWPLVHVAALQALPDLNQILSLSYFWTHPAIHSQAEIKTLFWVSSLILHSTWSMPPLKPKSFYCNGRFSHLFPFKVASSLKAGTISH